MSRECVGFENVGVDCCDSAVGVDIENYVFSNALDGYFLYQMRIRRAAHLPVTITRLECVGFVVLPRDNKQEHAFNSFIIRVCEPTYLFTGKICVGCTHFPCQQHLSFLSTNKPIFMSTNKTYLFCQQTPFSICQPVKECRGMRSSPETA